MSTARRLIPRRSDDKRRRRAHGGNRFWSFAAMMLRYKRLLALGVGGALLDALCAFGGFGALMWVIDQLFTARATTRDLLAKKIASSGIEQYTGDLSWLIQWVPDERFGGFAFMLGVILLFALVGSCGRFVHQYSMLTVSLRTVLRVRKKVFDRLVHLPVTRATREGTADMLSRVVRDCALLINGFTALTNRALRQILVGTVFLAWALIVNWRLTAIFMISLPFAYILLRKFGKKVRRANKQALVEYGAMVGSLQEVLQGLSAVKVHHAEGYERRRFNTINRRIFAEEVRARIAKALSSPLIELLGIVAVMGVALAAFWYMVRYGLPPEQLIKVLGGLAMAGAMYRPLAGLNNLIQEASAAAGRIDDILRLPIESSARSEAQRRLPALPAHAQDVAFEHVSFTYPGNDSPTLRSIDLRVPQGKVCAVVGPNGSGKTTLLGLLPRLYEPTQGRVRIDGHELSQYSLRSIRRQIALVSQQTVLFDGTVAENIRYGSRHVSESQMVEAAKRAHAHAFIQTLPKGYQTQVGEQGNRLSGGQRQRIAIARAILRDPAVLILDEATSQVDSHSEAQIAAALHEFMRGRTTFVIAHRLSTVIDADMIVVLREGRIVSTGTHEQLMGSSEDYQKLCRTQLRGLDGSSLERETQLSSR